MSPSKLNKKMSSEVSSANGKKKTKKLANVGSSSSNEILSSSLTTSKSQTNRIGPRVYKCVILGDGGVGKSGKHLNKRLQRAPFIFLYRLRWIFYQTPSMTYFCHGKLEGLLFSLPINTIENTIFLHFQKALFIFLSRFSLEKLRKSFTLSLNYSHYSGL